MLRNYKLTDGKIVENVETGANVFVYISPNEAEKKYLIDVLKIDEHTLNSSLDPDELSRLEFEPAHTAMIFMRPKSYVADDNFLFKVQTTGLFLFSDYLVVVMSEDSPIFEGKIMNKVQNLQDVALRLLHRSVFHFTEHLKVINMISSDLEQKITKSVENKYLLNLFTLEKSLVYYLNAINSNSMLIEKLKFYLQRFNFGTEQVEFLDDLVIENKQCFRQAEIYSQVLSGLMDAWASIVSNNLNHLIKTLTIITIAIMLPNLVLGIFSMNVKLPVSQEGTLVPFIFIMIAAVLSIAGVFIVRAKKKW